MPITPRTVCKALHKPLTIWGVDRRLFFLALMAGGVTFNLFYSLVAGILMALAVYGFAFATRRDPQLLTILLKSRRYRVRYDAGKHELFQLDVTEGAKL